METVKEFTQIESYSVEIWRRPYQRSMNLRVGHNGQLRITCGRRIPVREIERFVGESRAFIDKRVLELKFLRTRFPEKQFSSGETFLFFGEFLSLEIIWTWTSRATVLALEGRLEMLTPVNFTCEDRRKAMHSFFKKQARLHLEERVRYFASHMGLFPQAISIRGQRTRWGSCSARGGISLNWKLVAAPPRVIDYVVIHELAHMRHMNHSARFWTEVERIQPDYKDARRWLKEHEFELGVQFQSGPCPTEV